MPLRFLGGPSRSEITNVLIPQSLWDNIFYWYITFQDINGFTLAFTGTGIHTMTNGQLLLSTGVNVPSSAQLYYNLVIPSLASGLSIFSWTRQRRIRVAVHLDRNANQTIYITSGGYLPAADRYIGFKIVDNQVFGCVGNGGAETLTAALAAFAAGDDLVLEARFVPAKECRFYINSVDSGVLTVGLPAGTANSTVLIDCHLSTAAGAGVAKTVSFYCWEFYQVR